MTSALAEALPLYADADLKAFTMTGELADIFPSREAGVATLLNEIEQRISGEAKLIYAGRSGFVTMAQASSLGADVASANWHATAAIVAKLAGGGLFVDMGSTTTDLIAIRDGAVANRGYSDAERLLTGELVYTGFTRSYPLRRGIFGAGARTAYAADERIFRLHGRRAPDHGRAR